LGGHADDLLGDSCLEHLEVFVVFAQSAVFAVAQEFPGCEVLLPDVVESDVIEIFGTSAEFPENGVLFFRETSDPVLLSRKHIFHLLLAGNWQNFGCGKPAEKKDAQKNGIPKDAIGNIGQASDSPHPFRGGLSR
jgi:hypothetical protein